MRPTHAAGTSDPDARLVARGVIDANAYMTLATADGDGRPWASPVWFAHRGYKEFSWVSRSAVSALLRDRSDRFA